MNNQEGTQFRTGEFAEMTGVTVRTLRFYDREKVFSPSGSTSAGHRLYSRKDFARFQQVMTLKFLGLSLDAIRKISCSDLPGIIKSLKMQRAALKEKIHHLERVQRALDRAGQSLEAGGEPAWENFIKILEAIAMENKYDWFRQFYTEEQLSSLAERQLSPQDQQTIEKEWAQLYDAVRNALHLDPASDEVQALAARWSLLVEKFTLGDAGMTGSLAKAYEHIEEAPPEVRRELMERRELHEFIGKALALKW